MTSDFFFKQKFKPHSWKCFFREIFKKFKLTKREIEVLKLVGQAMSNKEIAKELYISDQTVSVHRKNIMKKLDVNSTASLIKFSFEHNLIWFFIFKLSLSASKNPLHLLSLIILFTSISILLLIINKFYIIFNILFTWLLLMYGQKYIPVLVLCLVFSIFG